MFCLSSLLTYSNHLVRSRSCSQHRAAPTFALSFIFFMVCQITGPAPSQAQSIGPVEIPAVPDGTTWIVLDQSQSPGTPGEMALARPACFVSDLGNQDGTWTSGEPLKLRTVSVGFTGILGTAIQQTDSEFRIPFTVSNSGSYRAEVSVDHTQCVSSLGLSWIGLNRSSFVVGNKLLFLADSGTGPSVISRSTLSDHEEIEGFGAALTETAMTVFLAGVGVWFDFGVLEETLFLALETSSDVLNSGAAPEASFTMSHQFSDVLPLNAGTQYYLALETDSWVWAQVFALLGMQWTSAKIELILQDFTLEEIDSGSTVPPQIQLLSPTSPDEFADAVFHVRWADLDPDSNAAITLYFDSDTTFSGNEPLIVSGLFENDEGYEGDSFFWDTESVTPGTYYVYAEIADGINDPVGCYSTGTVRIEHCDHDDRFLLSDHVAEDDNPDGDCDGVMESGESIDLTITLCNDEALTYEYLRGDLTSVTSGVLVTDSHVHYGTLQGSGCAGVLRGFGFVSDPGFVGTAVFNLSIQYEVDGVRFCEFEYLSIPISDQGDGAHFEFDYVEFDDSEDGDGDGVPESGEDWIKYYVYLKNCGTATATEVRAEVGDVAELELGDRDEQYPGLPPNCSPYPPADGDDFWLGSIPANYAGTVYTDITVTYGPCDSQQVIEDVPLFVIDAEAWLATSPRDHNFGVSSTTDNVHVDITIRNAGTEEMTVTGINMSQPTCMTPSGISLPATVPAGGTVVFTVQLSAGCFGEGVVEETATVISSDARLGQEGVNVTTITGLISDTCPDIRLTTSSATEGYPDVDGSLIAWEDNRNGNCDIYAHDLSTGTEFPVATGPSSQIAPKVEGNYIAWMQGPYNEWDIYVYDKTTGITTTVATDPRNERLIGIDGDRVVFVRDEYTISNESPSSLTYGIFNLFYYDIGDAAETRLTSYHPSGHSDVFCIHPTAGADCDAGLITFSLRHFSWSGSYYWNHHIEGLYKFQIGVDGSPVQFRYRANEPGTDNLRVVWADDNDSALDEYQIWMWMAPSGPVTQVTTEATDHETPLIADDYIVYRKYSAQGLYYWDLSLGEERAAIVGSSIQEYSWRISGHLLVWSDNRNGSWDIYYKYLDTSDLGMAQEDIQLSVEEPIEGQSFDIDVTVHNMGCSDHSGDVTVQLFDGDPEAGAPQIGSNQVIAGGITVGSGQTVTFASVSFVPEGNREVCAMLIASGDPPGGNKACREFEVLDSDTSPPTISNVTVAEHNGDGDDVIEEDEEVRITWTATDPSGIGSASCTVEGVEYPAQDTYEVVIGPFSDGEYLFSIQVTDNDHSPETAYFDGAFSVELPAPQVIGTSPEDEDTDVSLLPEIWAEFNTGLDPASVSETTVIVEDPATNPMAGSVSYDDGLNRAIFALDGELANSTVYTVRLLAGPEGILDQNGNEMDQEYVWSFTTVADTTPPTASIVSPTGGTEVDDEVQIVGTAWDENFDHYELFLGEGCTPTAWTSLIGQVEEPVLASQLGTWDTSGYAEGDYSIRLVVTDAPPASNVSEDTVCVQVSHCEVPATPTDATATPNPACEGESVILTATPDSSGDTLAWYADSCGGALVGTGPSVEITAPAVTTTYYVRAQSPCGHSACASVELTESCTGACCLLSGRGCLSNLTEEFCESTAGGVFAGNGSQCDDAPNPCDFGACCAADCTEVFRVECIEFGGDFQGAGTVCDPNPCPGACCYPDGSCVDDSPEDSCAGSWLGAGTSCEPDMCLGACCIGEALDICVSGQSEDNCLSVDGAWGGPGSQCDPNPCVGACCVGSTHETCVPGQTEANCLSVGGQWAGVFTDCDPSPCPLCEPGDVNRDGLINGADIEGFVEAMLSVFDPCADMVAPIGVLDGADLTAFVDVLLSQ